MVAPMGSVSCGCDYFNRYMDKGKKMKVQTKINDWSVVNTGNGIACKYLLGKGTFELCLSVSEDGEVEVQVHKEGVDAPVLTALLEE